ncbi:hypothetical protein Poly59_59870 [Rubripirellula reticaptiva]|uniref:Uncharacterized protein n=2 Tax=Rubripirellula reticaptiva TaxID=2528013 RepID=A0A5C6EB91_9BACT|nr:hypothetical protein Poly59_59870 [Rubripirellula reticaptiva]
MGQSFRNPQTTLCDRPKLTGSTIFALAKLLESNSLATLRHVAILRVVRGTIKSVREM